MATPGKDSKTDLKVFISNRESTCGECGEDLGRRAWITLQGDKGALCLTCSDLDHLLYLPAGDAALTRRARKGSTLSAVVLKWSRARHRYERQGLLVEEDALDRAEEQCAGDADVRKIRRARAAIRREEIDQEYVATFAAEIRKLFPHCPPKREYLIARHACRKYSGRIGRSAWAKELAADAVRLAVAAHVRHAETPYDDLLATGTERHDARACVRRTAEDVLDAWEGGPSAHQAD